MGLKDRAKDWLFYRFGVQVYRDSLPWGTDFGIDVKRLVPGASVKTVFDVGAHVGQTALHFARHFPSAQIHSFEPVPAIFEELVRRTKRSPRVTPVNLALGDQPGTRTIKVGEGDYSSINSLVNEVAGGRAESIRLSTLDDYCRDQDIDHIDILKIDVEGFELQVLRGATQMLRSGAVDFMYLETELRNTDTVFVPFEALDACLAPLGYEIFGVYDQTRDEKRRRRNLLFVNLAYIRSDLAGADSA